MIIKLGGKKIIVQMKAPTLNRGQGIPNNMYKEINHPHHLL